MNSQNKFIAKGISLIFFWLIVIATLATLFGCEPEKCYDTITYNYSDGSSEQVTIEYDCNDYYY